MDNLFQNHRPKWRIDHIGVYLVYTRNIGYKCGTKTIWSLINADMKNIVASINIPPNFTFNLSRLNLYILISKKV